MSFLPTLIFKLKPRERDPKRLESRDALGRLFVREFEDGYHDQDVVLSAREFQCLKMRDTLRLEKPAVIVSVIETKQDNSGKFEATFQFHKRIK